ncbi:MAG: hypothetical protein ACK5F7_21415, partial [Planctomycetaceae bacterium]
MTRPAADHGRSCCWRHSSKTGQPARGGRTRCNRDIDLSARAVNSGAVISRNATAQDVDAVPH